METERLPELGASCVSFQVGALKCLISLCEEGDVQGFKGSSVFPGLALVAGSLLRVLTGLLVALGMSSLHV